MKKILIMMLVLAVVFVAVGCGNNNNASIVVDDSNEANTPVENAEEETSNEEATNEEATNEEKTNEETSGETTSGEGTTDETTSEKSEEETAEGAQPEYVYNPLNTSVLDETDRPVATIEFEDGKKIVLKLVPELAPNTVNNYITLAQSGYYDGIIFHRIIPNFMIQGGDPNGTGSGGPGYTINDEFYTIDELTVNYLSHAKGIISMAKTSAPDSAGSQFFIVHADSTHLDGQYAAFGYVVEGLEVVDEIAAVKVGANDKPEEDVVIKTITIELNGYDVQAPIINE